MGGGSAGKGWGFDKIMLKFLDQIPQGGKRKVDQKCQKSPYPRGKKSIQLNNTLTLYETN